MAMLLLWKMGSKTRHFSKWKAADKCESIKLRRWYWPSAVSFSSRVQKMYLPVCERCFVCRNITWNGMTHFCSVLLFAVQCAFWLHFVVNAIESLFQVFISAIVYSAIAELYRCYVRLLAEDAEASAMFVYGSLLSVAQPTARTCIFLVSIRCSRCSLLRHFTACSSFRFFLDYSFTPSLKKWNA